MDNAKISPVYIITRNTKAIMAKDSAYYRSLILEDKNKKFDVHNPEYILDNNCLRYGSTLAGKKAAAQDILKCKSKLPIPVIPEKGVYMLPTSSARNKDCVWLSYYHITYYEQCDDKTYVGFHDGTGIYVNASEKTIDMQYKKTSQVIAMLNREVFFTA